MKYDAIMGVDPGVSGGIVVLSAKTGKVISISKTPVIGKDLEGEGDPDIQKHLEYLSQYTDLNILCAIEKVGGRYGDSAHSAFSFGHTVGIMRACLTACYIPFQSVPSKRWQKYYGMSRDSNEDNTKWKNRLKDKAKSLYPEATVTLWNADAILIAHYCLMVLNK